MSAATIASPPVAVPTLAGTTPSLMTADEFFRKYENHRVELVRGVVEEQPMPDYLHGFVCGQATWYLQEYIKKHDLGRVMNNDSFVKVRQNPDSVRGADVCFISYSRLPKGPIPAGLLDVVPVLVVEVRSPSDSWTKLISKVLDYLAAGVQAVVVFNPMYQAAAVYQPDFDEQHFTAEQELTIPDLLPGFSVPAVRFFS
jgi:Uma2 family endonuclease